MMTFTQTQAYHSSTRWKL